MNIFFVWFVASFYRYLGVYLPDQVMSSIVCSLTALVVTLVKAYSTDLVVVSSKLDIVSDYDAFFVSAITKISTICCRSYLKPKVIQAFFFWNPVTPDLHLDCVGTCKHRGREALCLQQWFVLVFSSAVVLRMAIQRHLSQKKLDLLVLFQLIQYWLHLIV